MKKDKIRDILRSILPSKADRSARFEKRYANKTNRVRVKQSLRQYAEEDWEEDYAEVRLEANIYNSDSRRKYEIRMMKSERRGADKINHFIKWCERRTAHLENPSPQEKYYYISGLIGGPSTLIREHALGHFMSPSYDFNVVARARRFWRYNYNYVAGCGKGLFDRAALRAAITQAFECCPQQLNQALKGGGGKFDHRPLFWRSCYPDKDACSTSYTILAPQYTYQVPYMGVQVSWRKPTRYVEGTLASQQVDKVEIDHKTSICANTIIVRNAEDIERLVVKILKTREVYIRPYYEEETLVKRLIPFLITKGYLEHRNV